MSYQNVPELPWTQHTYLLPDYYKYAPSVDDDKGKKTL